MNARDYAGLIAPILAFAAAAAGHLLAPAAFAEVLFWSATIGAALVGVSNRFATPPRAKLPLPPGSLNALTLTVGISLFAATQVGCSPGLGPSIVSSSDAVMCIILDGMAGDPISQIVKDCAAPSEEAVVEILTHFLAEDLGGVPDSSMFAKRRNLTPLQRANIAVSLQGRGDAGPEAR